MLHLTLRQLPLISILGQVRQPSGWKNRQRTQLTNLMIFVQEGDLSFEMEHQTLCLHRGDYLLLPTGMPYAPSTEEGCRYHFVHFELAQAVEQLDAQQAEQIAAQRRREFVRSTSLSAYALPMDSHDHLLIPMYGHLGGLQEKIRLLLAECDMQRYALNPQRKVSMEMRFAEILNLLDGDAAASGADGRSAPPVLSRILLFIHQHYTETLTLARLGAQFDLSRQYIAMLFRQHVGASVTQYVNQLKLDHARDLLRFSTFRIGEIAERLGFGSAYYFCRLFRRQYGMTPSEYIRLSDEKEK